MTDLPWIIGTKFQRIYTENTALTVYYDFVGGNLPIYVGEAASGTGTATAEWRIQKRGYNGSSRLISITWAGNGKYNQKYSDRATLTFS